MKKPNNKTIRILKEKREKKKFKRKRKNKQHLGSFFQRNTQDSLTKWKIDADNRTLNKYSFSIHDFLNNREKNSNKLIPSGNIIIPKDFRFEYQSSIVFKIINEIRESLISREVNKILIDFSKCTKTDFASLFILRTILDEYIQSLRKFDKRLHLLRIEPQVVIKKSFSSEVQSKLLACEIIRSGKIDKTDFIPISAMKFYKGTKAQSRYDENRKGPVATKIRKYIDGCLQEHSTRLTPTEESNIDGIISEILNNAEDHSDFNTWYSYGNFFQHSSEKGEFIGEINLAFMNFGNSIYQGLLETSKDNEEQFKTLTKVHDTVKRKDSKNKFNSENLYTLYALQDGVSRLKYKSQSRGTGTMTFINSFLELGDFESMDHNLHPRLIIYSGNTKLKCDNKFKPFKRDTGFYLSLNDIKDIKELPASSHLETIDHEFPGTLITAKLYLNKEHLHRKIDNGKS